MLQEGSGQGGAGSGRDGGEALSLPLLYVLHLQAEGGEAGQQVGHFVHLRRKPRLCDGVPRVSPHSTTGAEAGTVSPPRACEGFTLDYGAAVQG